MGNMDKTNLSLVVAGAQRMSAVYTLTCVADTEGGFALGVDTFISNPDEFIAGFDFLIDETGQIHYKAPLVEGRIYTTITFEGANENLGIAYSSLSGLPLLGNLASKDTLSYAELTDKPAPQDLSALLTKAEGESLYQPAFAIGDGLQQNGLFLDVSGVDYNTMVINKPNLSDYTTLTWANSQFQPKSQTLTKLVSASPSLPAVSVQTMTPFRDFSCDLGSPTMRFANVYTYHLYLEGQVRSSLTPYTTDVHSLGSTSLRWNAVNCKTINASNLKALAFKDQIDWNTDVLNKPVAQDLSSYLPTASFYPTLKSQLVAGGNITLSADDAAKTITVVAATPDLSGYQPLHANLTDLSSTTPTLKKAFTVSNISHTNGAATSFKVMAPNLIYNQYDPSTQRVEMILGQSETSGQAGVISYVHGSSSATTNTIGLGLYGKPNILTVSNDVYAAVKINSTTSSSGKNYGALVVQGGIGCGENISCAGRLLIQSAASAAGIQAFLRYNDTNNRQLWFQDTASSIVNTTYPALRIGIRGDSGVAYLGVISTDSSRSLPLYITSSILPDGDNFYSCGSSANRWSVVYSTNAAISTSDELKKLDIQPLQTGLNFVNALEHFIPVQRG